MTIDLSIDHVSKRYRIRNPESGGSPLRRLAGRFFPTQHDFWALRDVCLQVRRGETTGIIGHNGAGKSTLMKLLSGITAPSEGEIRVCGRMATLIELGSGFHPELTGRENVFMSGAVLGMRRREILAKFDRIVDFAGIGDFIDVPVKWYSSGMYVRLGFAIAAHIDVDILLVDEVLAVGDAAFQTRCYGRLAELKRAGTTIVIITHDLSAIERLTERAMLLDHGRALAVGPSREVVATYQRLVEGGGAGAGAAQSEATVAVGRIAVVDWDGQDTVSVRTGDPVRVRVEFDATAPAHDVVFDVFFYSFNDGSLHAQCSSETTGGVALRRGRGCVEFDVPALGLQAGVYTVGATVTERAATHPIGWQYNRTTIYVEQGVAVGGRFFMPHAFRMAPDAANGVRSDTELQPGRRLTLSSRGGR